MQNWIRINVSGPCQLAHLELFRDLYYTQLNAARLPGAPGTGTYGHPITLGAGDYFALGDNSRRSADSRIWDRVYPALGDLGLNTGVVPERYLLGKAFFVYWPAGFRPSPDVPGLNAYPIVPDTGDMRVIR